MSQEKQTNKRYPSHTQDILIMIDVRAAQTILIYNFSGEWGPLKPHQMWTMAKAWLPSRMASYANRKYEKIISNILLAQHNKFQYNGKGSHTERGKWSIAVSHRPKPNRNRAELNETKDETRSLIFKQADAAASCPYPVTIWIQFRAASGCLPAFDLCPVTEDIWFACFCCPGDKRTCATVKTVCPLFLIYSL